MPESWKADKPLPRTLNFEPCLPSEAWKAKGGTFIL